MHAPLDRPDLRRYGALAPSIGGRSTTGQLTAAALESPRVSTHPLLGRRYGAVAARLARAARERKRDAAQEHYIALLARHVALIELSFHLREKVTADVWEMETWGKTLDEIEGLTESLDREIAGLARALRRDHGLDSDALFHDPQSTVERAGTVDGAIMLLHDDGTLRSLGVRISGDTVERV